LSCCLGRFAGRLRFRRLRLGGGGQDGGIVTAALTGQLETPIYSRPYWPSPINLLAPPLITLSGWTDEVPRCRCLRSHCRCLPAAPNQSISNEILSTLPLMRKNQRRSFCTAAQ